MHALPSSCMASPCRVQKHLIQDACITLAIARQRPARKVGPVMGCRAHCSQLQPGQTPAQQHPREHCRYGLAGCRQHGRRQRNPAQRKAQALRRKRVHFCAAARHTSQRQSMRKCGSPGKFLDACGCTAKTECSLSQYLREPQQMKAVGKQGRCGCRTANVCRACEQ